MPSSLFFASGDTTRRKRKRKSRKERRLQQQQQQQDPQMRKKPKTFEAVLLPHDGYIHWLQCGKGGEGNVREEEGDAVEAVYLLNNFRTMREKSPTRRLLNSIQEAKLLSEQLQAIQAFRSQLLHLHKTHGSDATLDYSAGLYWILLEWSISQSTPQNLRRAIQSSLEPLVTLIDDNQVHRIRCTVLQSLWETPWCWSQPLTTVFEVLNYSLTRNLVVSNYSANTMELLLSKAGRVEAALKANSFEASPTIHTVNNHIIQAVDATVTIASTSKLLLTQLLNKTERIELPQTDNLQQFCWKALSCRAMNPDALAKVGISYGQLFVYSIQEKEPVDETLTRLKEINESVKLPPLNVLCAIQGITAALPDRAVHTLLRNSDFTKIFLKESKESPDPTARLSALRGLQTIVSRMPSSVGGFENFIQETLDIVLLAWENPPGRQVASAIPNLFQALIPYLGNDSKRLLERIMGQPPNRKGKYIALEMLLPKIGAKILMESTENLVEILVQGVGDRGHNAGVIAELLGKLLNRRRMEMNQEAGIVEETSLSLNKKERRKLQHDRKKSGGVQVGKQGIQSPLLPEWIDLWAPSIAKSLLSESNSRQRQSASFCLPLLVTIVGGDTRRVDASFAFLEVLSALQREYEHRCGASETRKRLVSHTDETLSDRFLWAKLEIAKRTTALKLFLVTSRAFIDSITHHFPITMLRTALTHSSGRIRLAAFEALPAILPAFRGNDGDLAVIDHELELWRYALPYGYKSAGKEYTSMLLRSLWSTLDRASLNEAESLRAETGLSSLPRLASFVRFLIDEILVDQAAYPGTVADKESFALSLFRCILAFLLRNDELLVLHVNSKPSAPNQRRLRPIESKCHATLLSELASDKVFEAFLSLLFSVWDNTRSEAFECLATLAKVSQSATDHCKPAHIFKEEVRRSMESRGLHLASSPRQREADTGARMIAFLYVSLPSLDDRKKFIEGLVNRLSNRVMVMAEGMESILSNSTSKSLDQLIQQGLSLPLGHGLFHAAALILHQLKNFPIPQADLGNLSGILVDACCDAIDLSLSVIADVQGDDEEMYLKTEADDLGASLSVNTGAIGANATFSSVGASNELEDRRRFATQRVLIGSWLLTKEACTTLATAIVMSSGDDVYEMLARAGEVLITTMTSLKHQGAAFASHKAFEEIACYCVKNTSSEKIRQFPSQWISRLLSEISSTGRVRDSTLRRSTGYALGFLSMMRSEPPGSFAPKSLCPFVLAELVALSLPPKQMLEKQLESLGLSSSVPLFSLSLDQWRKKGSQGELLIEDLNYEPRCRVHALNILRLIILDAPLASDVRPFISDAIIASMLGYTDDSWGVRNSSTMVFSAAMLRVVDSDKNANKKDGTSGNAITAVEMFRQYPSLPSFICCMLKNGVSFLRQDTKLPIGRQQYSATRPTFLHPPIFLVLLLLARIQPVDCGGGGESYLPTDMFIEFILSALGHQHQKIRVVAARALANLSSSSAGAASSRNRLMSCCCQKVTDGMAGRRRNWNLVHGSLLGIEALFGVEKWELRRENDQVVEVVISLCNNPTVHPSCMAVAVTIWSAITAQNTCSVSDKTKFCRRCCELIEISGRQPATDGASPLATACAKAACQRANEVIWDGKVHERGVKDSIEVLGALFTSEVVGARVVATKVFKKAIYSNIDVLIERKDFDKAEKLQTLGTILDLLLKSVVKQWEIDEYGQHPPTVRRLSRCLLEILDAKANHFQSGDLAQKEWICGDKLWKCAERMVGSNWELDNAILGNAVETMAYSLCYSPGFNAEYARRAKSMTDFVKFLTNPLGPWKSRYSAVKAVYSSGILKMNADDGHGADDGIFRSIYMDLVGEILKLLQDHDPDVRFIAARCHEVDQSGSESPMSTSLAQILAVETAFTMICQGQSKFDVDSIWWSALPSYSNFKEKLDECIKELSVIPRTSQGSQQPVDVGTRRKIFEEEDPNPYEEPLLTCQLVVTMLMRRIDRNLETPAVGGAPNIIPLAEYAIAKIIARLEGQEGHDYDSDPLRDFTRSNGIFGDLYSLLLLSCVIVFLGAAANASKVQALAREAYRVLQTVESSSPPLHPRVVFILGVLKNARHQSEGTKKSICRSCFLVPSARRGVDL